MQENSRDLPSGRWRGTWTETNRPYYPYSNPMSLNLDFTEGCVRGEGADSVGRFEMVGGYSMEQLVFNLRKRYPSHAVIYDGRIDEKRIYGIWYLDGASHISGGFMLWPEEERESKGERAEQPKEISNLVRVEVLSTVTF